MLDLAINTASVIIPTFRLSKGMGQMRESKDVGLILILATLWFGSGYYCRSGFITILGLAMWFGEPDYKPNWPRFVKSDRGRETFALWG